MSSRTHDDQMYEKYLEMFKTEEGFQEMMDAHKMSGYGKNEIKDSKMCGCFYCCRTYPTQEALDHQEVWASKNLLICPHCGIDAVIWDTSGFPATDDDFLKKMRIFWFY